MCGICGVWDAGGVVPAVLERMNATLVHRGPDDAGAITSGAAGLAMRRLSIIDLSHGHQPIANEDETAWVVCNGEIYNYRELRRELEAAGHRFRTDSDTEVILHLYEQVGDRLVDRLRGMFGFAVWDSRRRRLLLARDRFGQKPLFWTQDGNRLLFGSEIKSILAGRDASPQLDAAALDDYLALRFVPSPSTMFAGVNKLPPGHLLVLEERDDAPPLVDVRRYYDLRYVPKRRVGEKQAVDELRVLLREAVESHMVSDVRVGAYLSGGMDSSLIVALMAAAIDEPVPTFSIGVREQDFSELPFAQVVAEHCGTEHHVEVVSPDLVRLLPKMVYHLDEPSDPIAACMYHSAALAARHVKVVMGGDGGDELFAGFDRYFGFRWVRLYAAIPAPLRRLLLGPLLRTLPDSAAYKNRTQKLRWLHELSFHKGGRRYAQATVFFRFGDEGKEGLYTNQFVERLGGRDATECIVRAFDAAEAEDDLDRMLYCDTVTRMTEHSLMLTDRMTMAHSLEGRSPLLDHHLAEYVATLPSSLKMRGKSLKYLMRRACEPWLPQSILDRPKMGFMFPLGYWMKGPLLPVMQHLLGESRLVAAGIFRAEAIERLLREHAGGRADHHVRLWLVLNLEVWYRIFLLGESPEDVGEGLAERVGTAS